MLDENERPLVSVVVPVYNVENYLEQCISSILAQTYENIEIILVDDGSPDRSPAICDSYANSSDRVTVIHKPNGGLSSARNCGIALAQGDYITFVDSDDILHPEFIMKTLDAAVTLNADIVTVQLLRFGASTDPSKWPAGGKASTISKTELLSKILSMVDPAIDNCAPGRLYRLSLFRKIQFPVGLLYEDLATTYKLIIAASSLAILPQSLYGYRFNAQGITNGALTSQKLSSYIVGTQLIADIAESVPSLLPLAKSRAVALYFHIFMQIPADRYEQYPDSSLIWGEIQRLRRAVIFTRRRTRLKTRIACAVSYLGPKTTKFIFDLFRLSKMEH